MIKNKYLYRLLLIFLLVSAFFLASCGAEKSVKITIISDNLLSPVLLEGVAGDAVSYSMPEIDGEQFDGFYLDSEYTAFYAYELTIYPDESLTLYAKYSPRALYKLSFETGGGSAIKSLDVFAGEDLSSYIPLDPAKNGYIFEGWMEALGQATMFDFESLMPAHSITLYAKWSKNPLKNFYKLIVNGELYKEIPLDKGEPFTRPNAPVLDSNYIFDDWYVSDSCNEKAVFGTVIDFSQAQIALDEDDAYCVYANYYSKGLSFNSNVVTSYSSTEHKVVIPWVHEGRIITEIAPVAFANKRIKSIVLPGTIRSIGERAFYACSLLETVNLPSSLELIEQEAFSRCMLLSHILIPKNAVVVFENAFSGCESLLNITVDPSSQYYLAINGGVYTKDGERLLLCSPALTEFTVEAGTNSIAKFAFDSRKLEKLTIADSVESIDRGAIRNETSSLTELSLPAIENSSYTANGITKPIFNLAAIFGAARYEDNVGGSFYVNSLYVPSTLATVSITKAAAELSYSFYGCSYIKNINLPSEGIEYIGAGAFSLCYSLSEIVIPDSVSSISGGSIQDAAFFYCNSLKKITLPLLQNGFLSYIFGASHYTERLNIGELVPFTFYIEEVVVTGTMNTIERGAFYGNTYLKRVQFISNILKIESESFYDCTRLEYIEGLEHVEELGYDESGSFYSGAFANCYSLRELSLLGLSRGIIGSEAFVGVGALSEEFSFEIGEGVVAIGDFAFMNSKLASINLPSTLMHVGVGAFFGCTLLEHITIPQSVETIAPRAFEGCSALKSLELPMLASIEFIDNEETKKAFLLPVYFGAVTLTDNKHSAGISEQYHVPRSLKTVLFSRCEEGVVLYYSFYNCEFIEEITLSSELTEIGENSFFGCFSLKMLKIPSSVETINGGAFAYTNSLLEYQVSPQNLVFSSSLGVLYSKDNEVLISYPSGKKSELFNLPEGVRHIESFAFAGNVNIREVGLPTTLKSVGSAIFQNCTNLLTVSTSSGSFEASHLNYGMLVGKADGVMYAYFGSSAEVSLPASIKGIASYAFSSLSYIQRIYLGSDIEYIGEYAFSSINATIEFSQQIDLKSIGKRAFFGYLGKNIDLPSGIIELGESAFENSAITTLRIPSTLEDIKDYAFFGCSALSEVSFEPNSSLKRIGEGAFAQCNLSSFSIPSELISIGDHAFSNNSIESFDSIGTELREIGKYSFYANSLQIIKISGYINTISEGAFAYNAPLSSLVIEEGVAEIGDFAFNADVRQFGAGNPLCMLTKINIPSSVQRIGKSAFYGAGHYALPSGDDGVYWYYTNEVSLTIAPFSRLTTIDDNAFNMTRLAHTLDLGMTELSEIGAYAFANFVAANMHPDNNSLREIIFPSTLRRIGEGAFFAQVSLKEIELPRLEEIGEAAFYLCSSLVSIVLGAESPPLVFDNSFNGEAKFFVPIGFLEAYKASAHWQLYIERLDVKED